MRRPDLPIRLLSSLASRGMSALRSMLERRRAQRALVARPPFYSFRLLQRLVAIWRARR